MGGMGGGLYATGKSPAELKAIVEKQDWDPIIGGQTSYRDLSFRHKEDQRALPNRVEFGLRKGFSLPSGLNSGQGVSLLIDRETLAYTHNASFDDFPIPFRCVATNLVSGKTVVFARGSIAHAMRSTMSIPGVFAPVRDGDNVYVDGGLLGNLPTDVVRTMGADVVIAILLEIAPADASKLQSLFSVLGRSVEVVLHENELRGLAGADLIVNVDVKAFHSLEYNQAEAIIDRGSQAAADKSHILAPYALDDAAWSAYLSHRQERMKTDAPAPHFVEARGTDAKSSQELARFLEPLKGKPINLPAMEDMFNQLTGIGKFDSVDYWLAEKDDQTGLIVSVHEKGYVPPSLQLGFEADGSASKAVTFTQAGRLTVLNVAGYRSEWRTDFAFGNTYSISSELYRPFDSLSKWFFAPHASASNTGIKFFKINEPVALYRFHQENAGVDVGYGFDRFTDLRVGYQLGYSVARLDLGAAEFVSISGQVGDTHLRFRTDHTHDPIVPRRGYNAEATFHWYDAYPGAVDPLPPVQPPLQGFHPVPSNSSVIACPDS